MQLDQFDHRVIQSAETFDLVHDHAIDAARDVVSGSRQCGFLG